MEKPQIKEFYDWGAFRLDARNRLLWHEGKQVALNLKEFEVLFFLIENAGQVVDKNALLDAVWKDTFIEEVTLAQNISRLRRKLEAETRGAGEKIIETLPKRGYRFLPSVKKTIQPVVVIEEQTLQHIRIEETISVPEIGEGEKGRKGEGENAVIALQPEHKIAALQKISPSPFLPFSLSPLLLLTLGALAIAAVAVAGYLIYLNRTAPKITFIASVKPFSGAAGYENTPAFSPDGRQLAYAWNNGGERERTDIYVRLLGTDAGEPVRLTDTPEIGEQYPVFSPDGLQIAFVREFKTHGEIILIPALGGAERRVARLFSGNYSISFAPDGQSIAVVDTPESAPDKQHAIYLVNLKTGERRRLTTPGEFKGETTPRFAPDGKQLAFLRLNADYKDELFVVSTSGDGGGEPRRLTFDNRTIHSLAWGAGGQEIFFVSYRESNRANIWRIAAAGGAPELLATGSRGITNLAISPDGKKIAYVENTIHNDIWRLTAGDESPGKFIASPLSNEQNPQFSPDGSQIVFLSNRTGKNQAWLADSGGKNLRQITDSEFSPDFVRFSPDGTRIVYEARDGDNPDIFTQAIEGSAGRRLTNGRESDFAPAWSADGRYIYFTSNRTGANEIWRVPADGGGEAAVQITRGGALLSQPAPDGKTLFFSKLNSADLWQTAVDGSGGEQPVSNFAAEGFTGKGAEWTMTRAGIYFLAKTSDNTRQIKFYDFAAGRIKPAAGNTRIPDQLFGSVAASADGTIFLYALQDQNASSIMLAEIGK